MRRKQLSCGAEPEGRLANRNASAEIEHLRVMLLTALTGLWETISRTVPAEVNCQKLMFLVRT